MIPPALFVLIIIIGIISPIPALCVQLIAWLVLLPLVQIAFKLIISQLTRINVFLALLLVIPVIQQPVLNV